MNPLEMKNTGGSDPIWPRLCWVFLYAAAMGLLEAICVIYLRRLIIPAGMNAGSPPSPVPRMPIELIREICTIVMLVAVAWLVGRNVRARVAWFFYMFGVWDILYYAGLKCLAGWPKSLLDWDCLFLIPKPWYAPVLAPVLISAYFVISCSWLLIREDCLKPLRLSAATLSLQLLACILWFVSFVKDSSRILVNGYTGMHYSWLWFVTATVVGVVGLWFVSRSSVGVGVRVAPGRPLGWNRDPLGEENQQRLQWKPSAASSPPSSARPAATVPPPTT